MDTVFLAHSFQKEDRILVQQVADMIRAFGLGLETGRYLGGAVISDEVKLRIDQSDALVALLTTRADGGHWPTHPWVLSEYEYALNKNKPCLAVVDSRIAWNPGPHGHREHVLMDGSEPHLAVFELMQEIGGWKRNAGAPLQLLISDPDLIGRYRGDPARLKVEYRCGRDARPGPMLTTDRVMMEAGSLVVMLPSVPSREHSVELVITYDGDRWMGSVAQHYVRTELSKVQR